ncbi:MAG: tetratricopeptide repeat protein, partial [Planctomycetota bacterium]
MQSQRRPSGYGWGRNRWGGVRPLDALAGVGVLVGIGLLIWVLVGNRPPPASATQAAGEAEAAPAEAAEAVLATVQTLVQQDETDRARAVLAEAVKQFAGDQPLRLAYGDLLVSAGAPELAYEQFEAALAIGPRTPAIEFTAGALAHQMNNLERAHEHFAAAQASEPTHAEYAMRLGSVQVALGETEAGKASLLRAGVLDPGHAIAWGQLAEVALRENKAEIALGYVDKARAVQPDAVAWRVIEARARKRMGDAQGAVDVLPTRPTSTST